jgi:hypothetical protein
LALAFPIHLERGGKSTLSAKYEQANPPAASTIMKTRKLVDMSVSSMRLTSHGAGSNSMYADIPTAVTMVITKGTMYMLVIVFSSVNVKIDLRFCVMDCLNGGPTLRTIAERMYWKQEIRKSVVFCEFSEFECSLSSTGG